MMRVRVGTYPAPQADDQVDIALAMADLLIGSRACRRRASDFTSSRNLSARTVSSPVLVLNNAPDAMTSPSSP